MNYTLTPPVGSSVFLGIYKDDNIKVTVSRGYFGGGLPSGHWSNRKYQAIIASVDFRDGCHTALTILEDLEKHKDDFMQIVEDWFYDLVKRANAIDYRLRERDRLGAEIKPLEDLRSRHALELFDLVPKGKGD